MLGSALFGRRVHCLVVARIGRTRRHSQILIFKAVESIVALKVAPFLTYRTSFDSSGAAGCDDFRRKPGPDLKHTGRSMLTCFDHQTSRTLCRARDLARTIAIPSSKRKGQQATSEERANLARAGQMRHGICRNHRDVANLDRAQLS